MVEVKFGTDYYSSFFTNKGIKVCHWKFYSGGDYFSYFASSCNKRRRPERIFKLACPSYSTWSGDKIFIKLEKYDN